MTIREAIAQITLQQPESFTSDEVINLIRSKGFAPKAYGNARLDKDIHEVVQTHSKDIPYVLSGRKGGCAKYVKIK